MSTKWLIAVFALLTMAIVSVVAAASVTLAWDHSPDFTNQPGKITYRIYHQTNVPPTTNFIAVNHDTYDVGTNTFFTHTNLNMALPHVWAATAVGAAGEPYFGDESDFSNWVLFGPMPTVEQVKNVRMRP